MKITATSTNRNLISTTISILATIHLRYFYYYYYYYYTATTTTATTTTTTTTSTTTTSTTTTTSSATTTTTTGSARLRFARVSRRYARLRFARVPRVLFCSGSTRGRRIQISLKKLNHI